MDSLAVDGLIVAGCVAYKYATYLKKKKERTLEDAKVGCYGSALVFAGEGVAALVLTKLL